MEQSIGNIFDKLQFQNTTCIFGRTQTCQTSEAFNLIKDEIARSVNFQSNR